MKDNYGKLLTEQCDHILFLKQLHPGAIMPRFANSGDVGIDLSSVEDLVIKAGGRAVIGTASYLTGKDYKGNILTLGVG